jgi:hypothetical protein
MVGGRVGGKCVTSIEKNTTLVVVVGGPESDMSVNGS